MDLLLEGGLNEIRDERLIPCLIFRKASNFGSLVVPLVDSTVNVDTKDRGIGSVNELPKLASHCNHSSVILLGLCDILSDFFQRATSENRS
jgi:hypothetical protein